MATNTEKFRKAIELICECNQDLVMDYPVEKEWADVLETMCEAYQIYYKERFK